MIFSTDLDAPIYGNRPRSSFCPECGGRPELGAPHLPNGNRCTATHRAD